MPAKAGIQNHLKSLDSCLRENDGKGAFLSFYETINIEHRILMALRFVDYKTSEPQKTESENFEGQIRFAQFFLNRQNTLNRGAMSSNLVQFLVEAAPTIKIS